MDLRSGVGRVLGSGEGTGTGAPPWHGSLPSLWCLPDSHSPDLQPLNLTCQWVVACQVQCAEKPRQECVWCSRCRGCQPGPACVCVLKGLCALCPQFSLCPFNTGNSLHHAQPNNEWPLPPSPWPHGEKSHFTPLFFSSCRFRSTHTWKILYVISAVLSLVLSSVEIR